MTTATPDDTDRLDGNAVPYDVDAQPARTSPCADAQHHLGSDEANGAGRPLHGWLDALGELQLAYCELA